MQTIITRLRACMLIPVIALENAGFAEELAGALCRAGIPAAEVTFRTDAAAEVIRRMKKARPEMFVGAGTVLTAEQADRAKAAGAEFLVSPGLNPEVVIHAQKIGIPMVPGVCTPSEIEKGLSLGLTTLKFFPAEAAGGLAMIKAVSAPYPMVNFMPTGGINEKNLLSWLDNKKVLCCGGSWIVPKEALAKGDAAEVERLTREALRKILGLRVKRVSGMTKEKAAAILAALPLEDPAIPEPTEGRAEIVLQTPRLERVLPYLKAQGLFGANIVFEQE